MTDQNKLMSDVPESVFVTKDPNRQKMQSKSKLDNSVFPCVATWWVNTSKNQGNACIS